MSMDEVQAFDVMMEFLNIYQNEGFAVQSIIQELHAVRTDDALLCWDDWLSAAEKAIAVATRFQEEYW